MVIDELKNQLLNTCAWLGIRTLATDVTIEFVQDSK